MHNWEVASLQQFTCYIFENNDSILYNLTLGIHKCVVYILESKNINILYRMDQLITYCFPG